MLDENLDGSIFEPGKNEVGNQGFANKELLDEGDDGSVFEPGWDDVNNMELPGKEVYEAKMEEANYMNNRKIFDFCAKD